MVYLDNAATTKPFPEVVALMQQLSEEIYGNPSSIHSVGRKARAVIEQARKDIAKQIGAHSSEIIFTSGGTEADNIFLQGIASEVNHIIASPVEHPAVRNTLQDMENKGHKVSWLTVNSKGEIDLEEIEELLASHPGALLVAMHGNNEIGNLNDLESLANLVAEHKGYFFTDAVQTVGHYKLDLSVLPVSGLAASAHKFHGPKGAGFLYLKKGTRLHHVYAGGEQEKGLRSGTEYVAGIAGMAKALETCYNDLSAAQKHMYELKNALKSSLTETIPGIQFNGSNAREKSSNSILSASFPPHEENEMLQFNLDMAGVAVSAGSACASGAVKDSHVMEAIDHDKDRAVIRFSFSRFNTKQDIETATEMIRKIYSPA